MNENVTNCDYKSIYEKFVKRIIDLLKVNVVVGNK
jgi:hypothetical protein